MKNDESDIDEFSNELAKRGGREIDRSLRAHIPPVKTTRDSKSRITIYLDADIVARFKEMAEKTGVGYQTLLNESLRKVVEGMDEQSIKGKSQGGPTER